MLCKVLYEGDIHEIMLWKFCWNYQKHHVIGNHGMENHLWKIMLGEDLLYLFQLYKKVIPICI